MGNGIEMIETMERDGSVVFTVKVTPRAHRNAISGELQGWLKIFLTAPPVDHKANDELCKYLAERLNLPVAAVKIVAGERSRAKRVAVHGATSAAIQELATKEET